LSFNPNFFVIPTPPFCYSRVAIFLSFRSVAEESAVAVVVVFAVAVVFALASLVVIPEGDLLLLLFLPLSP
jgi:hypothetical protein